MLEPAKRGSQWDTLYNSGRRYSPVNEIFLDELLSSVRRTMARPPRTAIDVGCGTGDLAKKLARRGLATRGIDISPVAIAFAEREDPDGGATYSVADFPGYATTERFDLVTMRYVLPFVGALRGAIHAASALLEDDGSLVVITPVLLDGYSYSDHMKSISVVGELLSEALHSEFKSHCVFLRQFFDEMGTEMTFIAQLPRRDKRAN